MRKIIDSLSNYFSFTSDRYADAGYYERSVFQSAYFRSATIIMTCNLILGSFVCTLYWSILPISRRFLLAAILLALLGVWGRAIYDHRRMQQALRNLSPSAIPPEFLKMVGGISNFYLSNFYVISLILIALLGLTAHDYQHYLNSVMHYAAGLLP